MLDVASSSVHEIDEIAWAVLDDYQPGLQGEAAEAAQEATVRRLSDRFPPDLVREAYQELRELEAMGALFTSDAELYHFAPQASPVKSICLHVSHDCNLACGYCFADGGPYGGGRELMSPEVARQAVDFLIEASGDRSHAEIDFFGGEPLMAFDVVKETVAYARKRGAEVGKTFTFTLTSNGTLITREIQDYLNQENISLILSLDGRQEVHDRHRPRMGGQGSYDSASRKIKDTVERRRQSEATGYAIVRGTFTRNNLDFAADVRHMVDDLGFTDISLEPAVGDPSDDGAIRMEDMDRIQAEYLKVAEFYLERKRAGRPFQFFHFKLDLQKGPCLPKLLTGCGAGYQYLAIVPNGEIYPCHQFVGRPEYVMGRLPYGIFRNDLKKEFSRQTVYRKKECPTCWARFFCSGGCHANNTAYAGGLDTPYEISCELIRRRLEVGLWLAVEDEEYEASGGGEKLIPLLDMRRSASSV